jgi:O-antigen ligase
MGKIFRKSLTVNGLASLRPVLALMVLGVFMPYSWQNLILLVLPAWAWAVLPKADKRITLGGWEISYGLLWFWTLLSLAWSENYQEAFTEILSKGQWLIWPLVFVALKPWLADQMRWFARCTWISALIISLICVVDVLWRSSGPEFWFQDMVYENLARASGLHPIYLSMWVLLALVAYAHDRVVWDSYSASRPTPSSNYWSLVQHGAYLLFTVFMVAQLSSRMAMLTGLMMIGVFLIILLRKRKFRWSIAGGLMLLILIPLLLIQANSINRSRVSEMVDLEADYSTNQWGGRSLRIAKWKNTIECYAANPILGTGAGDFQHDLDKIYRLNGLETGYVNRFNSHNQYLQTLTTLGPVGLLLLMTSLLVPLWRAWQQEQWTALMILVILLSSMLTESMLERQKGLYIVCLMSNGYFWGLYPQAAPKPTKPQDPIDNAA